MVRTSVSLVLHLIVFQGTFFIIRPEKVAALQFIPIPPVRSVDIRILELPSPLGERAGVRGVGRYA